MTAQSYTVGSDFFLGDAYGAGIGGGRNGSASDITIRGGRVTAQSYATNSAASGAGIGGGKNGSASYITVEGGTVTAQSYGDSADGAGIGGGDGGSASYITVKGGTVTAQSYGNVAHGAGIGGGRYDSASYITIEGGTVTAQSYATSGYADGAGIGGGEGGSASGIAISGGRVDARSGSGQPIGKGNGGGDPSGIVITGGRFADTSEEAVERNLVYGIAPAERHVVVENTGDDNAGYPVMVRSVATDFVVTGGTEGVDWHGEYATEGDASSTGVLVLHPQDGATVLRVSMADVLEHPSSSTADGDATRDRIEVVPADGVAANVVLDGVRIDLSGDTAIDAAAFTHLSGVLNLTLAKGSENSLVSGRDHAGLEKNDLEGKASEGFALTIDSEGDGESEWGSLLAQSYGKTHSYGAGIGGGRNGSASHITISDGTVTAQSYGDYYSSGAGIGGGDSGSASNVTITGGTVTAQSYSSQYAYGAHWEPWSWFSPHVVLGCCKYTCERRGGARQGRTP